MTFADLKARTRRQVHSAFAIPCVLVPASQTVGFDRDFDGPFDGGYSLTARLHERVETASGERAALGYATIMEHVSRVIFNREELADLSLTPARLDYVSFPDYGKAVKLNARVPYDGPVDEIWTVISS